MIALDLTHIHFADAISSSERQRVLRLFGTAVSLAEKMINNNTDVLKALVNIYYGIFDRIHQGFLFEETVKSLLVKETSSPTSDHTKISNYLNGVRYCMLDTNGLVVTIHNRSGASTTFDLNDAYGGFSVDRGQPTIYLCPMCFSEELGSDRRKILLSAIVFIHEAAHALKYPNTRLSTPRSLFFQEYLRTPSDKIRYDGGSAIEHLLMNAEMHLTTNLKEIVLITPRSDEREIGEEIIEHVLARQDAYLLRVVSESAIGAEISLDRKIFKITSPSYDYAVSMPYRHKVMMADENKDSTKEKLANDVFIVRSPSSAAIRNRRCVKMIQTKNEEESME